MWLFFGFITTLAFVIASLIWRLKLNWKGKVAGSEKTRFEYRLIKNQYLPNELYIGIEGISDIRFRLKAEAWYDKLFKLLKVSREYQTGIPAFDDTVYIASDNSSFHSIISREQKLSSSILEIFNHPSTPGIKVKAIKNHAGKIWIEYTVPRELKDDGVLFFAEKPVSELNNIVETINQQKSLTTKEFKDPFVLKAIVLLAISSGLAIYGVARFIFKGTTKTDFMVDDAVILDSAVWIGSALSLALIAVSLILLKQSSRTHLVILELAVVGTFGVIFTTDATLRDVNSELDQSLPAYFEVSVTEKERRRRRRGRTSYYLTVNDWNMEKNKRVIEVPSEFYERIETGDWLVIRQRAGYLNHRWVDQYAKK